MDRKEFIKLSSLFGMGLPISQLFGNVPFSKNEKVLIIGAGAAGLSCGYFLKQLGVPFQIIEASATYGGRMKSNNTFTDFPIPLGAEWIHTHADVFSQIINNSAVSHSVQTKAYEADASYGWVNKGKLSEEKTDDSDLKFVGSTWYDFFDEFIASQVKENIVFSTPIKWIDYSKNLVMAKAEETTFTGSKVIVTAPVKVLQEGDIQFNPRLPEEQQAAIENIKVWQGFKAFIEFEEKFYHTITAFKVRPKSDGQKLYYDAAYGQKSKHHIMGLFAVGVCAEAYYGKSNQAIIEMILDELNALYAGKASKYYKKHITQNWGEDPFIKGAYVNDHENWRSVKKLGIPVDEKLYFAGGAYTDGENWENVHTAALSAKKLIFDLFT